MFCPNCGKDCGDAKFCSECGQDLRSANEVAAMDSKIPEPPVGIYENHDRDYVEMDATSITFCRNPLLGKTTKRTIRYDQIEAVSFAQAVKLRWGGFLSIQKRGGSSKPKSTVQDAVADETSITFSWKQNDDFLKVFDFLKVYADTAIKDHQVIPSATMTQKMNRSDTQKNGFALVNASSGNSSADDSCAMWQDYKRMMNPEKAALEDKKEELDRGGQAYCPKCLSTSISANQKGFGFIRGALGANIALDVGLIAGGIGSKKIICTCLKCGHQWKPGKK